MSGNIPLLRSLGVSFVTSAYKHPAPTELGFSNNFLILLRRNEAAAANRLARNYKTTKPRLSNGRPLIACQKRSDTPAR